MQTKSHYLRTPEATEIRQGPQRLSNSPSGWFSVPQACPSLAATYVPTPGKKDIGGRPTSQPAWAWRVGRIWDGLLGLGKVQCMRYIYLYLILCP